MSVALALEEGTCIACRGMQPTILAIFMGSLAAEMRNDGLEYDRTPAKLLRHATLVRLFTHQPVVHPEFQFIIRVRNGCSAHLLGSAGRSKNQPETLPRIVLDERIRFWGIGAGEISDMP